MNQLLERIRGVTGAGSVLTGESVAGHSAGVWSGGVPLLAAAIVRPGDTREVAAVLSLCHEARQSVVVHGGRTGLVRGIESGPRDVVLSLERMRRIESVDSVGRTLAAEAGVTLQAAQQAADAAGLLLPLDMGSRGSATLGGAAATNAGGNRVLRYGMTRALVLGLEAVLANGTVVTSLNRMLKNNAGFDLKQVFIGNEGTLGVITRLVFRLVPRPASRQTALVAVRDFTAMTQLLSAMDEALAGTLSAFEAMWESFYRHLTQPGAGHKQPLPADFPYYVLLEAEGSDQEADDRRFEAALSRAASAGLLAEAAVAKSERERDDLWKLRDDVVRFTEFKPMFLFDVSAPLVHMESYVERVRQALLHRWPQSHFFTFGHLADGNLHFCISAGSPDGESRTEVERIVYQPLEEIGGSVSAEHGIGLEKKPYLSLTRNVAEIELMRGLKRALDPRGILNPGKVLDV